jgi:hypothetical protein
MVAHGGRKTDVISYRRAASRIVAESAQYDASSVPILQLGLSSNTWTESDSSHRHREDRDT